MSNRLKFREDGSFTIIQFTDMHLGKDKEADFQTIRLIENTIDQENPDFIIFTGDLISGDFLAGQPSDVIRRTFQQAISPAIQSNLPWTAIFGNHDGEAGLSKEALAKILIENENCLFQTGPAEINGVGNYVITLDGSKGEKTKAAFYFFDSGEQAPEPIGGYEWIHPDQVKWYLEQSQFITKEKGYPIPSLAFFHIPLPEYNDVWKLGQCRGNKNENVSSPKLNSGLFTAMVEMGDIIGTFAGHDHVNDYDGDYHGIHLCYGRATGYGGYGNLSRGARLIRLYEGDRKFDTWLKADDLEASIR